MDNFKHYYKIVHKITLFAGAWPFQKLTSRILRVGLMTLTIMSVFIPQMAYQFSCKSNLQCTFESVSSYLTTIACFTKLCTLQLNNQQLKVITQHLLMSWMTKKTPEELKIMKRHANFSRKLSLFYIVYVFSVATMFLSVPLIPFVLDVMWPLNESRPIIFSYPSYYFVDYREHFFKILCHSVISWDIIFMTLISFDCLLMIYVEYICSMFTIIGLKYERLFSNFNKPIEGTNTFINHCPKKIVLVVHEHREILRLADLLENIFSNPFAIQTLIVVTIISISVLQITQHDDIIKLIRYSLFVVGQLIHLFWFCYEGQKLIDHSLEINHKIYNSFWYEEPTNLQKMIILLLMRSTRPSVLSAGKIFILSLASFSTALQTSMSYFTVLASV